MHIMRDSCEMSPPTPYPFGASPRRAGTATGVHIPPARTHCQRRMICKAHMHACRLLIHCARRCRQRARCWCCSSSPQMHLHHLQLLPSGHTHAQMNAQERTRAHHHANTHGKATQIHTHACMHTASRRHLCMCPQNTRRTSPPVRISPGHRQQMRQHRCAPRSGPSKRQFLRLLTKRTHETKRHGGERCN